MSEGRLSAFLKRALNFSYWRKGIRRSQLVDMSLSTTSSSKLLNDAVKDGLMTRNNHVFSAVHPESDAFDLLKKKDFPLAIEFNESLGKGFSNHDSELIRDVLLAMESGSHIRVKYVSMSGLEKGLGRGAAWRRIKPLSVHDVLGMHIIYAYDFGKKKHINLVSTRIIDVEEIASSTPSPDIEPEVSTLILNEFMHKDQSDTVRRELNFEGDSITTQFEFQIRLIYPGVFK